MVELKAKKIKTAKIKKKGGNSNALQKETKDKETKSEEVKVDDESIPTYADIELAELELEKDADVTYMNDEERIALEDSIEEEPVVSTQTVDSALAYVCSEFNLDSKQFVLVGFSKTGNKCKVSLSNQHVDIVINICDCEAHAIF